ncbi:acyltransferase [Scytonema tolypothrichoides VB-61278]|nr:acyltransferase [Scytonema tolypothrichoides VB-61278]
MILIESKINRTYVQERLLTTLLGGIPNIALGGLLRSFVYRTLFARIGKSVNIQHCVELLGTSCIEIGDQVRLAKDVQINASGDPKNRVSLANRVKLQRGVDIRSLHNTRITIDEDTYIGPYVCIAGPGDIKIGKACLIAPHSGIFANNHIFADPTQRIGDQGVTRKGIVISDDCWLGHNVTVLDGVTIGKGSIIGAGSVVSKDIPPYSIAVGAPARVIKSRLEESSYGRVQEAA